MKESVPLDGRRVVDQNTTGPRQLERTSHIVGVRDVARNRFTLSASRTNHRGAFFVGDCIPIDRDYPCSFASEPPCDLLPDAGGTARHYCGFRFQLHELRRFSPDAWITPS